MKDAPRLAVLISGQGRNLQAILDAAAAGRLGARVCAVISNVADVPGLARARAAGVPALTVPHRAYAQRADFDAALAAELRRCGADLIALAGFMRVLGADFIRAFEGRMLNIHPSLLPRHPGLHTHRRVLEAGETRHGASVHFVTEALDGGPVVIQGGFSVGAQDTETTLAERVMTEVEVKIFPQALAWLARGELALAGDRARLRGRALEQPLQLADLEPAFAGAAA